MKYLTAAPGGADGVRVARRQRGRDLPAGSFVRMGELWERGDVGVMLTPASGKREALFGLVPFFAWDTGNFTRPVVLAHYLDLLAKHRGKGRFLFATAPDVVADWPRTWELSRGALPLIRALGYPAAIVAQDGMTRLPDTDTWDVLFIGGSTAWKLGNQAERLIAEAKSLGRWVHVGRVNSWKRMRRVQSMGADSADGTCLAFNPPQYVREIGRWLARAESYPTLPLWLTL